MTHDNFPKHGGGEGSSEFEPASEETKKELFEFIKANKHSGHYTGAVVDDEGSVIQPALLINGLYPQDILSTKYGTGYVFEEDRVSINGETLLGTISQKNSSITPQENGELDYNGLQEIRVYELYLTPDGTLEIKKMTRMFDRNEFEAEMAETDEAIAQQNSEKLEEIYEKGKSRTENKWNGVCFGRRRT
jgi:hypothetical protein